jgi:hypothetical protein
VKKQPGGFMVDLKIAHIINPLIVDESSDLYVAQPITFETMKRAKESAKNKVDVELFAAFFPEDEGIVPGYLKKTKPLEKSILDIKKFDHKKKLPLIKDILDRLYEKSTADYFIYTNVDIALKPGFYLFVRKMIHRGYDGFVINRRTISKHYSRIDQIPKMAAEKGEKHPGYDCFIFRRAVYPEYILGSACIGANWIGKVIISNVITFANQFRLFENEHVTFHIGDNRSWENNKLNDYHQYNEIELNKVLNHLMRYENAQKNKLVNEIYNTHFKNWNKIVIPGNAISLNSPVFNLPTKPRNIYHSNFRNSGSWEKYEKQLIRQDPIFIVGHARSGTTLVQSLIATQSNIYSFPETNFFWNVRPKLKVERDRVREYSLDDVLSTLRSRSPLSKNAEHHIRLLAQQDILSPKMLFEIIVIDNLLNQVDYKKLKEVRWMEKTPNHEFYLDVISRFYPQAKIVYVIRNPEKTILSRRTYFNEENFPVKIHVEMWLDSVNAIEKFKKIKPASVLIVRLEDIIRNTSAWMAKICKFLDISFDKEKLKLHKEIAKKFILPWEYWKSDVCKNISSAMALRKGEKLTTIEHAKLISMTRHKLRKYNYLKNIPVMDIALLHLIKIKRRIIKYTRKIVPNYKA